VIEAVTGRYKSTLLINLAATSAMQGKLVYISTHEMKAGKVGQRLDMRLGGMTKPQMRMNSQHAAVTVQGVLDRYKSRIIIKQWLTGQATWAQVRGNLRLWASKGVRFDVLFVDYLGILRCNDRGISDPRFKLKNIAEGLRAIAMELDVPVWTAHQINRSAKKLETVSWEHSAESQEVPNTADVIVTINQTDSELASGTGRLFVAKNRDGKSNVTIPIVIKPETWTIREL
jgi:replicative DNA helicase